MRLIAVWRDKKFFCWPVLTFLTVLLLVSYGVFLSEVYRLDLAKARGRLVAEHCAADISMAIEHTLSVTYVLDALLQEGDGEIPSFPALAARLLPMYPGAAALQLAPGGVVTECFPLEGNEPVIGHDLFHDPQRMAEAVSGRDGGRLLFFGPYALLQGGQGGIGRLPVFLPDFQGRPVFWGFVTVLTRYPETLQNHSLQAIEKDGYSYELWRYHPETGEKMRIAASPAPLQAAPIETGISVPGNVWYLSLTPQEGWMNYPALAVKVVGALVFSLLLAWLVHLMLQTKASESAMKCIAMQDELTRLPNRRGLMAELQTAWQQAWEKGSSLTVGFFDIDAFKAVNDTLGHDAGDHVLCTLSARLRTVLPPGDYLGRLGGDEFLFVLCGAQTSEQRQAQMQALLAAALQPILWRGTECRCSISIGFTCYPKDPGGPELLVQHADRAMYEAKRKGKGRIEAFSPEWETGN